MTEPCKGHELLEAANDFELVVKSGEKYCDNSKRLSSILSLFFAMRSAFAVRMSFDQMEGPAKLMPKSDRDECCCIGEQLFPALARVKSAMERLATAVISNNESEVTSALAEMGVFALCPVPDEQLSRMERLAENISGRARLVFLIELALFGFELGDFDASRRYVTEAWGLFPSAWELYNLCILEGLFALDAGWNREAIRWLEKSLEACQADEHTSLYCGIRPPNFLLVERLFERGERIAVLEHLTQCRNVWQLPRMPMGRWINLIECGKTPDFQDSGFAKGMNQPSCRLSLQWMRARSLESAEEPRPAILNSKSPAEVVAARKKLADDLSRYLGGRVADTISYLDKEREPNQHSRNESELDEPE